jgi:hypothetical protein
MSGDRARRRPAICALFARDLSPRSAQWRGNAACHSVFGRPSRAELLTLGGCAVLVASAAAWVRTTAQQPSPTPDVPPPQTALLEISSVPSGASVLVDGQAVASTPVSLALEPGPHTIVVRGQDAVDESRTVDLDANRGHRLIGPLANVC